MTQGNKTAPDVPGDGAPRLNYRQLKVISAIIGARSYEEAIPVSGVCRQTFYKYLRMDHVKTELDRQLHELTDGAFTRIKTASGEAVEALRALLSSESESIRLRAAQAIVDYVIKARELNEIETRLDEIEAHLALK